MVPGQASRNPQVSFKISISHGHGLWAWEGMMGGSLSEYPLSLILCYPVKEETVESRGG